MNQAHADGRAFCVSMQIRKSVSEGAKDESLVVCALVLVLQDVKKGFDLRIRRAEISSPL